MLMKKASIFALASVIAVFAACCNAAEYSDWDGLEKMIRDGTVDKVTAKKRIVSLHRTLKKQYGEIGKDAEYRFPVLGYGPDSIGGVRGSGFRPKEYDFYDGNRHGGHPAHDIFIKDENQDTLDDDTGKPVGIAAYAGGVVLAVNTEWEYPSDIRSGKYVWIFTPALDRYCYYVHLGSISVKPGDIVAAGQAIGTLGRTGKNAYPRRSPTHLHFSCLTFNYGKMTPYNTYKDLLRAQRGGERHFQQAHTGGDHE